MPGNRLGQGAHRTHAHTRRAMPWDLGWPAGCSRFGAVHSADFQRCVLCFRPFAEFLSFTNAAHRGHAHTPFEAGAFIGTLREAGPTPASCSRIGNPSGDRRPSDRSGPPPTGTVSADTVAQSRTRIRPVRSVRD